ncbi:MAG: methyltransferase domain-containing protein [Xanthomonadales bacterium]|nr:methyltransferase domain-containing protein [Xanthomonadales bacterium]
MIRVNCGAGHWKLEGWINVDLDPATEPDFVADLTRAIPLADESVDYMHAEDFMDQVSLAQGRAFLRECRRVLKPEGVLRLLTPDLRKLARLYLDDPDELKRLWREDVGIPLEVGTEGEIFNLGMRLLGHRFVYDGETLQALCRECGFQMEPVFYGESRHEALKGIDYRKPDGSVSMYFECWKSDG